MGNTFFYNANFNSTIQNIVAGAMAGFAASVPQVCVLLRAVVVFLRLHCHSFIYMQMVILFLFMKTAPRVQKYDVFTTSWYLALPPAWVGRPC